MEEKDISFEEWTERMKELKKEGEFHPFNTEKGKQGGEKEDDINLEEEKGDITEEESGEVSAEFIQEREEEKDEGDIEQIDPFQLGIGGMEGKEEEEILEENEREEEVADTYEEAEEYRNNEGGMEQVSADLFGFTAEEKEEEETSVEEEESKGKKEKGKVSFKELRNGRKIPRLKKNLVLTICFGVVIGFLVLVNVLASGNKKERLLSSNERRRVEKGKVDLSELSKKNDEDARRRAQEEGIKRRDQAYGDGSFVFEEPPPYEGESQPWQRGANSSGNRSSQPVVVDPQAEQERIQREQQAAGSSLRKDGGYGLALEMGGQQSRSQIQGIGNLYTSETPMTREEYGQSRISEYERLFAMTGQGSGTGQDKSGRYSEAGTYNPNNTGAGNFEYFEDNAIFPGTIIHAVLVSRIDTDYPGPIHARVTENIYDSKTGKNLLIPQGTILQGNYSSSSIGVDKVQIAWEAMVVNFNGVAYQVSLGGMAGVDKRGRAGIAGTLDDHYFEWLKAAGIVSLFTMLNSEINYQAGATKSAQVKELIDVNQGLVSGLGIRIMTRALDIQPTVRIANGKPVSVAVNKAVVLRPFKAFEAEQRYVRKNKY